MSTPTPVALDHDPFLRELLARTQRTKDAAALRFLAVNDTHLMVRYGQAALWFKAEGVVALSGSIEPDRNGPYVAALQRVIDAVHKPEVVAPIPLDADSPALSGAGACPVMRASRSMPSCPPGGHWLMPACPEAIAWA